MCGICGFNWENEQLVEVMTQTLRHRGPDDKGAFSNPAVSLGQTRLSIIDISPAGHQPMFYDKKRGACSHTHHPKNIKDAHIVIVFNGEIYNFQDLKAELETKGYAFSTKSDTEVVIASYLEWDTNCVKKFNGMWAFCIYDFNKKILFCSRDRIGKKPFYYYYDGERFIFGSELKAILKHDIKKEINKDAIDIYLTTGFIPSPLSIFNKVYKIEPRQSLVFDLKNKSVSKHYYYQIPRYKPTYDKKRLIQEGRSLLKDATRLRLIADVPVGAFLSGGLDSSSVVASMAAYTDLNKLHTFSIGFEGKYYDESEYMKIAKNFLKTRHHHKYYREQDFEKIINKISYYYDEPFCDDANFPTYEVSRLARQYVTVSLSGDGGDEIFGGYFFHKLASRLTALRVAPSFIRKAVLKLLPKTHLVTFLGRVRKLIKMSLLPPEDFYTGVDGEVIYEAVAFKKWRREKMKEILGSCNGDIREAIIRYDLFYNTLGDTFLVKVDRASMAHALEVRCPFLDYRFIELESQIPSKWKTNPFKTKILMREIKRNPAKRNNISQ
jgi:asparagine synthase (glutamine-hydrolysing)